MNSMALCFLVAALRVSGMNRAEQGKPRQAESF